MSFYKNDKVYVISLKRWGKVLDSAKNGKYRVRVERLEVLCAASDLTKGEPEKKKGKGEKEYKLARVHPALKPAKNPRASERVDLHGMRVLEAMAEVERRIDRAIIEDLDRLEIIHGVGTGRIMQALHKYLASVSFVSSFKMDDVNPGVTWVYF